jgi:hypothetical protein
MKGVWVSDQNCAKVNTSRAATHHKTAKRMLNKTLIVIVLKFELNTCGVLKYRKLTTDQLQKNAKLVHHLHTPHLHLEYITST